MKESERVTDLLLNLLSGLIENISELLRSWMGYIEIAGLVFFATLIIMGILLHALYFDARFHLSLGRHESKINPEQDPSQEEAKPISADKLTKSDR